MKHILERTLKSEISSIVILLAVVIFQIFLWMILAFIGITFHKNEIISYITDFLSVIWLFIPLLSLFGIIVGIIQIRKLEKIILPLVGTVLNSILLVLYLTACYFILTKGVSA